MSKAKSKPKKKKPRSIRQPMQWVVPIDPGLTARIWIDPGASVVVDFDRVIKRVEMTPAIACAFGLALEDASRDAGAARRKLEQRVARANAGGPR